MTGPITRRSLSVPAILALALLSAVAPLATDMYLPGFPMMANDLQAGAAPVQLTLTGFLLGLAFGQLVLGPLSDRLGRRLPLLAGTLLAVVAAVLCAIAPNIETLILFRFLQGAGGAAGIVLARAIISDRTSDASTAAQLFQVMMMIGGLAPVLAPIAGTGIVAIAGWRGVFGTTALLSLLSLFGAYRFLEESLPAAARSDAGLAALVSSVGELLRNRAYLCYTFVTAFSFMALFGYIAASPFVMQNVLGLSPAAYSIAFGTNAMGIILFGAISAKVVRRVGPRRLVTIGIVLLLTSSLALLAANMTGSSAIAVLPALFLAVASVGIILGNASALAIGQAPGRAGTASAFLGALQFGLGALAAPLVGLGGSQNPFPMTFVMLIAACLALFFLYLAPCQSHSTGAITEKVLA